ncbi:MAG: hypothetical protein ACR2F6_06695 [Mycobacteriales bacterium]
MPELSLAIDVSAPGSPLVRPVAAAAVGNSLRRLSRWAPQHRVGPGP